MPMSDPESRPRREFLKTSSFAAVGALLLPRASLSQGASLPVVNVRSMGARGDGVTNDTDAFYSASRRITESGGGTLFIPPGTYIVGRQRELGPGEPNPGDGNRRYAPVPIIKIVNCRGPVVIRGPSGGSRPVLRTADGLRYGSFAPASGDRYDPRPPDLPPGDNRFLDRAYRTDVYPWGVIYLEGNSDVRISRIEVNGNLERLRLGGVFGEV